MLMNVNNLDFNIRVRGEGEPFLWAHGFTSSMIGEDLRGTFEWDRLSEMVTLVRYDARGHGETEPSYAPSDYCWSNLARDMLGVADCLETDRFIAGGQAMGCGTALHAALHAPDRIKRLILMNPPLGWEERLAKRRTFNTMAMLARVLGGKVFADIMAKNRDKYFPSWWVEATENDPHGHFIALKAMKRRTLFNLFRGVGMTNLPSREAIRSINSPTIIFAWPDDSTHPIETATELNDLMPHSELVIARGYSDILEWPGLVRDFIS